MSQHSQTLCLGAVSNLGQLHGCIGKKPFSPLTNYKFIANLNEKNEKGSVSSALAGKVYVHCLLPFSDQDCGVLCEFKPLLACRAEKTDAVEPGVYSV